MVLQEVLNGSTPPPSAKGVKNGHSPWSAPRERKRRTKPAPNDVLGSIEELECATSPPKRHNGGSSPAARELALAVQGPPCFRGLEAPDVAAVTAAGPLAQGLVALPTAGDPTGASSSFSPLANGLRAPSFSAGASGSSMQFPWHANATDKQRKQLRHAVAYRLAVNRRADAGAAAAAAAAECESQQPADAFCSQQWQSVASDHHQSFSRLQHEGAPPAAASAQPPNAAAAVHYQHQRQRQEPQQLLAEPLAAAHLASQHHHHQQQEHPLQGGVSAARCSTGQDMETDMHCSWDSEHSAEIGGWQTMQAQLCAEVGAGQGPDADAAPPAAAHFDHHGYARLASLPDAKACSSGYPCAMLCASADAEVDPGGGASPRGSLEGPLCSDRQASVLPLRGHARTQQWQSHMASPPGDDASADPLLGPHLGQGSSGSARQRTSRGGHTKWSSCFSCASPFSCRQTPGGDSDEEVVRRTDSTEGFVIRRKPSSPQRESPHGVREEGGITAGGGTAGRLKRASLNQPPVGEDSDLVHRQGAFSGRCASTPGDPYSPCSEGLSDDSFSLASGPGGLRSLSLSVGLRDASIEELAGGLASCSEGGPTPTVDALNDMLKALSLRPSTHPKDAEEMVAEACQKHAIQPNATTARTLEKLWAVHEQLNG